MANSSKIKIDSSLVVVGGDFTSTTDNVDIIVETTEVIIVDTTTPITPQNQSFNFNFFRKDPKSSKIGVFENNISNNVDFNSKTEFDDVNRVKLASYYDEDVSMNNTQLDEGEVGDIIVGDDTELFINNEGELILKTSDSDGEYTINSNGELEVEF